MKVYAFIANYSNLYHTGLRGSHLNSSILNVLQITATHTPTLYSLLASPHPSFAFFSYTGRFRPPLIFLAPFVYTMGRLVDICPHVSIYANKLLLHVPSQVTNTIGFSLQVNKMT